MALSKLSGDEAGIVFSQLCNVLEPRLAVYLSSASNELWAPTQAQRQQLKADHEAAAALCCKAGLRSCKELREAKDVAWRHTGLSATDLATLGTLGLVLPKLQQLYIFESAGAAGPDGVQRLATGLAVGALPAVTMLSLGYLHMGDAGALALAAALGRGAMPRLKSLHLIVTAIGDTGLVALAPALRRLPALEMLVFNGNPFGNEGLAALVAPPSPTGVLPPRKGGLTKLKKLDLSETQVNDAGCAALASALDSGALPAIERIVLRGIPAKAVASSPVYKWLHLNCKKGKARRGRKTQ